MHSTLYVRNEYELITIIRRNVLRIKNYCHHSLTSKIHSVSNIKSILKSTNFSKITFECNNQCFFFFCCTTLFPEVIRGILIVHIDVLFIYSNNNT